MTITREARDKTLATLRAKSDDELRDIIKTTTAFAANATVRDARAVVNAAGVPRAKPATAVVAAALMRDLARIVLAERTVPVFGGDA